MPDGHPPRPDDDLWRRLEAIPDAEPAPESGRRAAPAPPDVPAPPPTPSTPPALDQPLPQDRRSFRIGAPEARPEPVSPDLEPPTPVEDLPAEVPLTTRSRPRRRKRWPRVVAALFVLGALAMGIWSWVLWERIDRVDTEGALSPSASFTNYLIVGTDSRAGVDPDLDTAANIGLGIDGERSDTMVILHVGDGGNHMVSLPRDLWVTLDSGSQAKLNAARAIGGVPSLLRTIQNDPGVPVHHYLEVDIAGFLGVIEAVGEITIRFDSPACDHKSGLDVRQTGLVALDAEQALAYVRSRNYREFDADAANGLTCNQLRRQGIGRVVGGSDLARTERQRAFLLAVFDRAGGSRNPVTVLRILSGLSGALTVDDTMGMGDAFSLFRRLRGLDATTHALPVVDLSVGGQSALSLGGDAQATLDLFRD